MENTVPVDEFIDLEILDACWAKMNTQLTPRERQEMNMWRMKLYMCVDSAYVLSLYSLDYPLEGIDEKRLLKILEVLKKDIGDIPMMIE